MPIKFLKLRTGIPPHGDTSGWHDNGLFVAQGCSYEKSGACLDDPTCLDKPRPGSPINLRVGHEYCQLRQNRHRNDGQLDRRLWGQWLRREPRWYHQEPQLCHARIFPPSQLDMGGFLKSSTRLAEARETERPYCGTMVFRKQLLDRC